MCIPSCNRNAMISFGLALTSYSIGALGAFSVYKFQDMSVKLMILAFMIGQVFALNFYFAFYGKVSDASSPRVSIPGESPDLTPQDSPQREGMRRSQELSGPGKPEESS